MAVMSNLSRAECQAEYIREEGVAITKADLRAAVDALDDWFDANAATLNSVLPLAARQGLSVPQKARLLRAVIAKRYLTGA